MGPFSYRSTTVMSQALCGAELELVLKALVTLLLRQSRRSTTLLKGRRSKSEQTQFYRGAIHNISHNNYLENTIYCLSIHNHLNSLLVDCGDPDALRQLLRSLPTLEISIDSQEPKLLSPRRMVFKKEKAILLGKRPKDQHSSVNQNHKLTW